MKTLRVAIVVSLGVIAALWWAVKPPAFKPEQGGLLAASRQLQCPAGSQLEGKLCTCPQGSSWSGTMCQVGGKGNVVSEKIGGAEKGPDQLLLARQKAATLPIKLASWPQKLDAINSSFPRVGSVAMIDRAATPASAEGRVALVEEVGESSLTIIEGNELTGELIRRKASGRNLAEAARELRIVGYYQP